MTMTKKRLVEPFITRKDIVILLCIVLFLSSIGLVVKLVLQKDAYVTVELLASGGEWWWGVPPPFYWNTQDVQVGAKEFDTLNKPMVEILDVVKYSEDDRKFMWMKVKLRVKRNYLTKEYIYRQESLEIGKRIQIAPNNIYLIGNVVGIEGVGSIWDTEYITLVGKALKIQPWEAEELAPGLKVLDNKGDVIAEVLEQTIEDAKLTTTTWQGEALAKKDPNYRDVTLKIRLRAIKDPGGYFFNYYQRIGIGNKIRIQFPSTAVEVNIMSFGASPSL